MAMSYHMEARIKQERINRWNEQKAINPFISMKLKASAQAEECLPCPSNVKPLCTDAGQFDVRKALPIFRVNQEGYRNRYQNRHHLVPHVDRAYSVMYPEKDNPDYISDYNLTHRRLNLAVHKYEAYRRGWSIHTWRGRERNRRMYDHSRNGPILESTWRSLQRELNVREKAFSTGLPGSFGSTPGRNFKFPPVNSSCL